ncbi:DsbA family oxidoreductase [Sedimenticola selenatireducens]|uniref:DsbA family oxidoreductase n=1 Tax=Sedimenticola selenatireducens TaxID=191960 RepID=A0A558DRM1_9GAMM|nr:DsbA family oxidoreductase [Sedimenticola selenatireducens]TVO75853.1 DsbA family oxidoreductase [Sedimenticola selenatireducens]TVT63712.1 MAG: DsbA family oxidoreductase [Sedimenticola selenatireducens]
MAHPLKLDIVSDVSCPWCVIGYKSLEQALRELSGEIEADITWQPFELNPNMPLEGQDIHQHLQEKYGSTLKQIDENHQMITQRGAELGFQFNFQQNGRIYNTFDAHRLLHWARYEGNQTDLKLALFKLYFTDNGNPSKQSDLLKCVERVGLPVEAAKAILDSDEYAERVREKEQHFRSLEINSVPTIIINDHYSIVGGHPVETFKTTLREVVSEDNSSAGQ